MAEIDLVSSHAPWSRTPHLVDRGHGRRRIGLRRHAAALAVQGCRLALPAAGARGLRRLGPVLAEALVSFVRRYGDRDTVVVVLGDHQPATIVSGEHAGHDVPVSVIARDPAVLRRISGWGLQDGLRPRPDAPVWRMDSFRDRFLTAFGRSH